jgi:hypothetical protein
VDIAVDALVGLLFSQKWRQRFMSKIINFLKASELFEYTYKLISGFGLHSLFPIMCSAEKVTLPVRIWSLSTGYNFSTGSKTPTVTGDWKHSQLLGIVVLVVLITTTCWLVGLVLNSFCYFLILTTIQLYVHHYSVFQVRKLRG